MFRTHAWIGCFFVSGCLSIKPQPEQSPRPLPEPPQVSIETQTLGASKLSWQPRADHVAMVIPYEPLRRLKEEIEQKEGKTLQSRPEASLTVLSPAELKLLRTRLSLEEIHQMVAKVDLQKIPYRPQCLAVLRSEESQRSLITYYLIVEAEGLRDLRRQVAKRFVEKGGRAQSFYPDAYRPRITVAYNERDLLRDETVPQNSDACIYQLSWASQPTEDARPASRPLR